MNASVSNGSSKMPSTKRLGWFMKRVPTLPLELARPSGNRFDLDASSRRGVPMPLQQTTTTRAGCSCRLPRRSKYTARRPPIVANGDFLHARPRRQPRAGLERFRPVDDVGGRFRLERAAEVARAAVVAAGAAIVVARDDRVVGRPPVPAELFEAANQRFAGAAERQRRRGARGPRRVRGIAGKARHADHRVVHVVEGLEIRRTRSASRRRRRRARGRAKSDGWRRGKCPSQWTVLPPTPFHMTMLRRTVARGRDRIVLAGGGGRSGSSA